MKEAGSTHAPEATSRRSDRREWAWIAVGLLLVGLFYVWTVRSNGDAWKFGQKQRDYYNELIDGFLDGHLAMKVDVPDALLRLPDPYDPRVRPAGVGLHDASFYKGKYYLYFGVAPVVTLMLPFRLLTGVDLPQAVAVLVFVYGGFLAAAATWLDVRRRYFPAVGTGVVLLCLGALGLAGLGPVLLRRPHVWELPIGAGYAFAMLTLACVWRSLHSQRRYAWFAAAGLMLGLAIASRLTYLPAIVLLGAPLAFWWRVEGRLPWRAAVAAAIPLTVIGGLLALYNYLRFDDPFQFGQAYQLSLDYEAKQPHFGVRYVWYNLRVYFFSVPEWTRYFPFINPPMNGPPKPAGYATLGDVYGLFVNLPLAVLAPVALVLVGWREGTERRLLAVWLGSAVLLFVATAGFMLCFFSALPRYMLDFAPALMLLGAVGVLAVEDVVLRWLRPWPRRLFRSAGALVLGFSLLFAGLFSLRVEGYLSDRNPRAYRDLARQFNRLPAIVERATGSRYGALELTLRFGPVAKETQESIMSVGPLGELERIGVRRLAPGRLQFVFRPAEGAESVTRPLAFDEAAPHRLRIELGALLPAETHPFFATTSAAEMAALTRRVRLDFDGETVLDARHPFRAAAAGTLKIGREASAAPPFARFSGEVLADRREEAATPESGKPEAFLRLRLDFPPGASNAGEPLASAGDATRGWLIFGRAADNGPMVFGWDAVSIGHGETEPIAVEPSVSHEAVVRLFATRDPVRQLLQLRIDGTLLVSHEVPRLDSPIVAGRNLSGSPRCAAVFSGVIHAVDQTADGTDPLRTMRGPLRLRVVLPRGRAGSREPLLAIGAVNAADFVEVEYVDQRTIRFVFDHWGSAAVSSDPVQLDFDAAHTIEIALDSLQVGSAAEPERSHGRGQLAIKLDGRTVWTVVTDFFRFDGEDLTVGRNPIGGTSCGPVFSGSVLGAERVAPE